MPAWKSVCARTDDFNGADAEGVGVYEITTRNGRRESAATAYLHPALRRPNLRLETDAHVTRITFDGTRATGVAYRQRGTSRAARGGARSHPLRRRDRLAAAAAALRHRRAAQLRALGIAVVCDQPAVGQHLQDHLCIDYLYRSRVPTLNEELRPWSGKLRAGLRYLLARRGPLALSRQPGRRLRAHAAGLAAAQSAALLLAAELHARAARASGR